MKRSIAGRGLAILWVLATAQVMFTTADDDSVEVYRAINEHKAVMVTDLINNKGLEKVSKHLDMSPLSAIDMNPTDDDDDDVTANAAATAAAEAQPQQYSQRPRPQGPAYAAPKFDHTETGTLIGPEAAIPLAESFMPEISNNENPPVNYANNQVFGGYPKNSKSVSKRPRVKPIESQQVDMSPLSAAVTNPMDYDNDDVTSAAAEEQQRQHYRRPRQRAPSAYVEPTFDHTETGTLIGPEAEIPMAESAMPEISNNENPSVNYGNGQMFGGYPRYSKPTNQRPRFRQPVSPEKRSKNSRPMVMV